MPAPSGNFSSTKSGRLQVMFSGEFTGGSSDWGSGTNTLVLRCDVGAGANLQTAYIRYGGANSAVLERDYVGGSGNVPVAMSVVSFSFDGPATMYGKNLRIACRLFAT